MELKGPIELTGSCFFLGEEREELSVWWCVLLWCFPCNMVCQSRLRKNATFLNFSPPSPGESRGVGGVKCVV